MQNRVHFCLTLGLARTLRASLPFAGALLRDRAPLHFWLPPDFQAPSLKRIAAACRPLCC